MSNDTHRELLQQVYEYIKLNIKLDVKTTFDTSRNARRILSEIRRLASLRRVEIQNNVKIRESELQAKKGKDTN